MTHIAHAMPIMSCNGCGKAPAEFSIYVHLAQVENLDSADEYVWHNEGTLNRSNGHFACDACYIRMGQPSSPRGWVAP